MFTLTCAPRTHTSWDCNIAPVAPVNIYIYIDVHDKITYDKLPALTPVSLIFRCASRFFEIASMIIGQPILVVPYRFIA